jgi:hypothetical protein
MKEPGEGGHGCAGERKKTKQKKTLRRTLRHRRYRLSLPEKPEYADEPLPVQAMNIKNSTTLPRALYDLDAPLQT